MDSKSGYRINGFQVCKDQSSGPPICSYVDIKNGVLKLRDEPAIQTTTQMLTAINDAKISINKIIVTIDAGDLSYARALLVNVTNIITAGRTDARSLNDDIAEAAWTSLDDVRGLYASKLIDAAIVKTQDEVTTAQYFVNQSIADVAIGNLAAAYVSAGTAKASAQAALIAAIVLDDQDSIFFVKTLIATIKDTTEKIPKSEDCKVSMWSPWSPCSVDCGGGTQRRMRTIVQPVSNNGMACPADLDETQPCNVATCDDPVFTLDANIEENMT